MKKQRIYLFFFIVLLAEDARYAQAADITVDGTTCTLADAITAANTNANVGGCAGIGSYGNDTVFLATDVLLTPQLPMITGTINIEGQGHTIDGNDDSAVGSVLCNFGNLNLNRTTITGGNSEVLYGGGGIDNYGTSILTNVTMSGNAAEYGGGVFNNYGTVIMTRSILNGNFAKNAGGGIYNLNGSLTMANSTVSGNVASASCSPYPCYAVAAGGGIFNYNGSLTMTNSTVSHNYVFGSKSYGCNGGGLYNSGGTVTLISSIISGNSGSAGSEIFSGNSASADGEIIGTINADNFNLFGNSFRSNTSAFNGFTPGSSDITATSDGTDPTALEAIFLPLDDNGGPTLTHALVKGSPAIDLDAVCSTGLSEDQRGEPRPVGEGCDAGAFEGTISFSNNGFLPAVYFLLL